MVYNWIYTTSNDNLYILFLILVILFLTVINFKLWYKKQDRFNNLNKNSDMNTNTNNNIRNSFNDVQYPPPVITNIANDLGITEEEKLKFMKGLQKIDGNDETLGETAYKNDIMIGSGYTSILGNPNSNVIANTFYSGVGNYATLDTIGSSMTDTLGGVNTAKGYTYLDDQLGIFTPQEQNNPYVYDNTANYRTGMDSRTVDGYNASPLANQWGSGKTPILLQNGFTGVANIFAPNIIIANPPLNSEGLPDISFRGL